LKNSQILKENCRPVTSIITNEESLLKTLKSISNNTEIRATNYISLSSGCNVQ